MLKVETDKGHTTVDMNGDTPSILTDLAIIIECVIESLMKGCQPYEEKPMVKAVQVAIGTGFSSGLKAYKISKEQNDEDVD